MLDVIGKEGRIALVQCSFSHSMVKTHSRSLKRKLDFPAPD